MKFRIKFHTQTYSLTFDDIQDDCSLIDFKLKLTQQLSSLRKFHFHLSLNGKDPLDENQTISESSLVNGDTIYILNEINYDQPPLSLTDRPLRLDEVQDVYAYPLLIHDLVKYSQPENDFDYMVIVLHALMIESGFYMDGANNSNLKSTKKSSVFYVVRYRHKLCEEERSSCSLAIMKTESLVTINGVVNPVSKACGKLSIHIGDYVHTQKEAIALNAVFPYRNLRNLSQLFKDHIANPLLCRLLEESGQCSRATLIGLPNEIKLRLAKYLPIKTLGALQLTCRDIHNTLNDNLLWHDLCVRDFDKSMLTSVISTTENDWHKVYGILYAQKQAILRHHSKSTAFFHPAFVSLPPPGHPTHRVLIPDPINPTLHPFPPTIYRPIPHGIFRICTANTQSTQTTQQQAQHHIYCQPFFGLKWVVIFAAATMIPLSPCFHHIWLG